MSEVSATDVSTNGDAGAGEGGAVRERPGSRNPAWKRKTHFWLRWTHVYTSMLSLLIVLFFGITGITLNHPDWTFGTESSRESHSGVLPAEAIIEGNVEFLTVSEYLRAEHGVKGKVTNFSEDGSEGTISYKNPGYGAEVFFRLDDATYELSVTQQGWITIVNDLHKGRDSASSWRWAIDVSGALLVVLSLTGLGIQFFLRKRRVSALTVAVVGGILMAILIWVAVT